MSISKLNYQKFPSNSKKGWNKIMKLSPKWRHLIKECVIDDTQNHPYDLTTDSEGNDVIINTKTNEIMTISEGLTKIHDEGTHSNKDDLETLSEWIDEFRKIEYDALVRKARHMAYDIKINEINNTESQYNINDIINTLNACEAYMWDTNRVKEYCE